MIIGEKKYPTSNEIMTPEISFKNNTIKTVLEWKHQYFPKWSTRPKPNQLDALEELVKKLCGVYGETVTINKQGDFFCFIPKDNTLCLDKNNPSIVSTLHEFRHKINGYDETSACRWSVQLFKKCFPNSFDKLEFAKGSHLLKRKTK